MAININEIVSYAGIVSVGGEDGIPVVGDLSSADLELISTYIQSHRIPIVSLNLNGILGNIGNSLAELLKNNRSLINLTFGDVSLSYGHIASIISALQANTLERIQFVNVKFSCDEDIIKLSQAMRVNTSLKVAVFLHCNHNENGMRSLIKIALMRRVTAWTNFYISGTRFSHNLNSQGLLVLGGGSGSINQLSNIYVGIRAPFLIRMLKKTIDEYNFERELNVLISQLKWSAVSLKSHNEITQTTELQSIIGASLKSLFVGALFKRTYKKTATSANKDKAPAAAVDYNSLILPRDIVRHILTFLAPSQPLLKREFLKPKDVVVQLRRGF